MQSKKFLVVEIDDTFYTSCHPYICTSKANAYAYILDEIKFYNLFSEPFEIKMDDKDRCDYKYGEDKFVVYQIFEIPEEATYAILYWHAYNGVDFELKSVCHYGENVREEFDNQINKLNEVYKFDDANTEQSLFVGDDGTEWHVLKIIEV